VRQAATGGVDGLVDAARLGEPAVQLVRDGGTFINARSTASPSNDGRIRREAVFVPDHFHRTDKIQEAMDLARIGVLVPRVAMQLPMESSRTASGLIAGAGEVHCISRETAARSRTPFSTTDAALAPFPGCPGRVRPSTRRDQHRLASWPAEFLQVNAEIYLGSTCG
jgi:hypothetical protein